MTPDEHYARGLELLEQAERDKRYGSSSSASMNAVLAQAHFSAALVPADPQAEADDPEVSIISIHNVVCADCGTVADDVTADDAQRLRREHAEDHHARLASGDTT